jgi:hypothetical protein
MREASSRIILLDFLEENTGRPSQGKSRMPSGLSPQAATAAHDPAAGGESKCSGGRFAHADRRRFVLNDRSLRSGSDAAPVPPPIRLTASIAHAAAVRKRWLRASGRSIGMARRPPEDRCIDDCLYYTGFDVPEEILFEGRPPRTNRGLGWGHSRSWSGLKGRSVPILVPKIFRCRKSALLTDVPLLMSRSLRGKRGEAISSSGCRG